jgi:uncharacterized cysteine cluster protein YcgN (CxxCxxCC family)
LAKRKKTFNELKKIALSRKEKDFESQCRKCGWCCHIRVGLSDGTYVIHPTATCKYLNSDNLCTNYHNRHNDPSVVCFTREEMINRDYILPEGCPYTKMRAGYKAARMVSEKEFDEIVSRELELGNYNILLVNRIY